MPPQPQVSSLEMESRNANRTIQPSKRIDGWVIARPGQKRPTALADSKADALKMARTMVRRDGGGEIRVKNSMGKVVESRTVRANPFNRRRQAA
jgi:hypothetical protein